VIVRTLRKVVGPAALLALFVGSGFVGIGGISVEGAGASDVQIHRLWQGDAVLTGVTFIIACIVIALRKKSEIEE